MILKGIYGLDKKPCGCTVKVYKGGKTITSGCNLHPGKVEYICGNCGLVTTKKELNVHKWEHAI